MDKLPLSELTQRVSNAKDTIPVGSKWLHYKGGKYIVIDHVIIELTNEVGIVYISAENPTVKFLRPLVVWQQAVEWEGQKTFRFRYASDSPEVE